MVSIRVTPTRRFRVSPSPSSARWIPRRRTQPRVVVRVHVFHADDDVHSPDAQRHASFRASSRRTLRRKRPPASCLLSRARDLKRNPTVRRRVCVFGQTFLLLLLYEFFTTLRPDINPPSRASSPTPNSTPGISSPSSPSSPSFPSFPSSPFYRRHRVSSFRLRLGRTP